MSKVILYIAASLDGYIATSDGSVSWLDEFSDGSIDYGFHEFFDTTDINILGATTYEQILGMDSQWPYQTKTFVATKRELPKPDGADIEFHDSSVAELVERARSMASKNIWLVGGASLAQSFLREGLLDELIITVMPLTLGDGIALFQKPGAKTRVKLLNMSTYDNSSYQVHYSLN